MQDEKCQEIESTEDGNPPPLPTIRCKFVVIGVDYGDGNYSLNMTPVIDGSPENERFWEYTPAGSLNIQVTNNSLDHFKVGDEYYIDIIPALNAAPLYPDPKEEMDVTRETFGAEISEPLVEMDSADPQFTADAEK